MNYVLYHCSLDNNADEVFGKLRKHARDGDIIAEYHDSGSSAKNRPLLKKAIKKCRETDAMLLVLDLSVIGNTDQAEKEGVQVKYIF